MSERDKRGGGGDYWYSVPNLSSYTKQLYIVLFLELVVRHIIAFFYINLTVLVNLVSFTLRATISIVVYKN